MKVSYKLSTRKWLNNRNAINVEKPKDYFKDIWEIVDRYNCQHQTNYRWWNLTDEVTDAILKWRDWHNPILEMVYEKMWVDIDRHPYVSLYSYDWSYYDSWAVYRFRAYKTNVCFIVANRLAIPRKLINSYPWKINQLIVKGKFKLLEQAIDYFCKNVTLDFSYKKWTKFISLKNRNVLRSTKNPEEDKQQ